MKFRLIKYLIPFIFLSLGLKGILCSDGYSKQASFSKVTKFKLPTRSTHSDSPTDVDDFVATSHFNSEESDSEEDDFYAIWFPRTSKDAHHAYINHISISYVFSHQLILNYLPKIYLKIRVLRL